MDLNLDTFQHGNMLLESGMRETSWSMSWQKTCLGVVWGIEHVLSLSNVIGYTRIFYRACAYVGLIEIGLGRETRKKRDSVAHSALQRYPHQIMHYTQPVYRQLCSGIVPNMLAAASACRPLPSPKDCQSLCSNKTERRPDISRRYTAS